MSHVIDNRVLEASTSSGTGPFTLAGAVLGFRSFGSVCAVADTVPYYIEAVDDSGRPTGDFEFGLGTYSAANQLTRTTVRGSSNGGLAVPFAAGAKMVGLGVPAPNTTDTRLEWRNALGFTAIGNSLVTAANAAAARATLGGYRQIQPVVVSVNGANSSPANGMRITLNPTVIDFRNATPGSGLVDSVEIVAPVHLDIPSGATLGTTNGQKAILAYGVLNNGGVAEGFVNNLAGELELSEQGLLTTTALSAASDLANVVYSMVARANVPYRLLGFLEVTQAAVGTWVTAPSLLNGSSSPLAMWLAGYGQAWKDVSGARASGVPQTNLTGRDIEVAVNANAASITGFSWTVDGFQLGSTNVQPSVPQNAYFTVPPGKTYSATCSAGFISWRERR